MTDIHHIAQVPDVDWGLGTIPQLELDGTRVMLYRMDDETKQIAVRISSEDADPDGFDHTNGEPHHFVELNDATLYDGSPTNPCSPWVIQQAIAHVQGMHDEAVGEIPADWDGIADLPSVMERAVLHRVLNVLQILAHNGTPAQGAPAS